MDPVTATTEAEVPAKRSKATSHLPLHKRQFYHSQSGQPMSLEEVMSDRDSENEADNEDAHLEDSQIVDDSMDENEIVEKFIQLWNSFVKSQRVTADAHIPWACEAFSRLYKKLLHDNSSLNWCWRLFMIKQWKYGLVDAATINKCNTIIRNHPNSSDSVNHPNDINNKNAEDMAVDKNDHKSKNNEDKETTKVFETAPVSTEATTQALGIESIMCRNWENDEMDVAVQAVDTESSQVVDMTASIQRSSGKRPIKQTQKMKEMIEMKWATFVSRGSRGRRGHRREGRGGRGCASRGGRGNLI